MAFVSAVGLRRCTFTNARNLCTVGSAVVSPTIRVPPPALRVTIRASTAAQKGKTQQETEWNEVSVLENSVVCEEHRYVVINVGVTGSKGSLCDSYRYPGQYVKMRRDSSTKVAFLAISCAPNIQGIFEFLIKDSPSTEWVSSVAVGDKVEMSPVGGKGFPISPALDLMGYPAIPESEVPRDILLFASGSGIAPIRACIESPLNGLNIAKRRKVKLYYSAKTLERMAYTDRFALWRDDGVEVIPVLSQGDENWGGRRGYLQDVLREDGIDSPKQTGALLCGLKGMTESVREVLVAAGVREDRILLNF